MFPIHDDTERLHGRPYLNYSLIAINAVVFIWEASVTGFFTNQYATEALFRNYGAVPQSVLSGNVASLVTSMFMHGGIAHIIGNMVFLFVFGDNLEDKFGRTKYLLMYIGWGMAAAILHSLYAVSVGGARGIPCNVSTSKGVYSYNCIFYNYSEDPCHSLYSILVHIAGYFCFHWRAWWCCILCTYRWICCRYGNWIWVESISRTGSQSIA